MLEWNIYLCVSIILGVTAVYTTVGMYDYVNCKKDNKAQTQYVHIDKVIYRLFKLYFVLWGILKLIDDWLMLDILILTFALSGGLASVIYTDTLQAVVLIIGATILFFLC